MGNITVFVRKVPNVAVEVSRAGPAGKSAYELWLEAGNVGTLQDFLAGGQLVYDYAGTQMTVTHNLGRYASVQCVDTETKKEYVPEIEWLTLDTLIIRTLSVKNLKIILK
jgi:hypothetical protein